MIEAAATGTGRDSLEARALAWIEDRQKLGKITEKTAVGYREKIRGWARLIGPKPYKKITATDLDSAFARLAAGETPTGRKPSPRTLHHYRTVLACFFNAMEEKDEIARNPMRGVEGVGGSKKTRRAPTADELQRMLAAAERSPAVYGQLRRSSGSPRISGCAAASAARCAGRDVDFERDDGHRRARRDPAAPRGLLQVPKTEAGSARSRCWSRPRPSCASSASGSRRGGSRRARLGRQRPRVLRSARPGARPWAAQPRRRHRPRQGRGAARGAAAARPAALRPDELHKAGVDLLTMQARAGHGDIRSTQAYITIDLDKDREAAAKAAASLI